MLVCPDKAGSCLASHLLVCPLLCSATDRGETRALESVSLRPIQPFSANRDGSTRRGQVSSCVTWFQGLLEELTDNSLFP